MFWMAFRGNLRRLRRKANTGCGVRPNKSPTEPDQEKGGIKGAVSPAPLEKNEFGGVRQSTENAFAQLHRVTQCTHGRMTVRGPNGV